MEVWKYISGYEGLYQVSNLGNVKSFAKNKKGKLMIPQIDGSGYLKVNLTKNKIGKPNRVHKLVAIAFLNHKPNGTMKIVVDHIDNNPLNNKLENLQLISQRENSTKNIKRGKSKYIGVYWHKQRSKWGARIMINKNYKSLGLFKTELEAHNAYQNKLSEILNK